MRPLPSSVSGPVKGQRVGLADRTRIVDQQALLQHLLLKLIQRALSKWQLQLLNQLLLLLELLPPLA